MANLAKMEGTKLIILMCCLCHNIIAEHHSHTIPVEGYETELQYLGQHVEIPEHPVKVVKITKTVAVKVPVPYPVKVIEKVPYPVHVAKPYPVPVPQIIKVPHVVPATPTREHEAIDARHGSAPIQNNQQFGGNEGAPYEVQEELSNDHSDLGGQSFGQSFGGQNSGNGYNYEGESHSSQISPGSSYDAPPNYFGYGGDNEGHGSFESQSYDRALQDYYNKQNLGGGKGAGASYH